MGRIDDVMNVSGHRIGTMEVESAIVVARDVAEAAVVGRPDEITGTAIVAFVTPRRARRLDAELATGRAQPRGEADRRDRQARRHPLHRRAPEDALGQDHAAPAARHRAGQGDVGDTTTLEDYSVIAKLRESDE